MKVRVCVCVCVRGSCIVSRYAYGDAPATPRCGVLFPIIFLSLSLSDFLTLIHKPYFNPKPRQRAAARHHELQQRGASASLMAAGARCIGVIPRIANSSFDRGLSTCSLYGRGGCRGQVASWSWFLKLALSIGRCAVRRANNIEIL